MKLRPWVGRAVATVVDWAHAGLDMVAAGAATLRRAVAPQHEVSDCSTIPVIILPGVLEPWRYLLPVGKYLARQGHPIHYVPSLGFNLKDLTRSAEAVLELIEEQDLSDVVLVAHSKGGLIGKTVLASDDRVLGMVSVSTPFAGSPLGGVLQKLPGARRTPFGMFFPGSPVLLSLAEQQEVNRRIISLAPAWDQVTPPESMRLPGAANRALTSSGHFRPIRDARTWQIIHDGLHELAELD